jgi:hypothetical protein
VITNQRFVGGTPYTRLQELPPVLTAFELGNKGRKYGDDYEVDFESVSYKLRQIMIDFRYGTCYQGGFVEKQNLQGKGHLLQLTFRLQEAGLAPDQGAATDFHIVLEVKGAKEEPPENKVFPLLA